MREGYIKEEKLIEKTEIQKEMDIITDIVKTQNELKVANKNFEYAQDELVDYYVYEIKAIQAKLNYLIRIAKIKGIQSDIIKEVKYNYMILQDGEEAV